VVTWGGAEKSEQLDEINLNTYEEGLDADNIEDELPDIFVPNVDNGLSNEDYDIIFRQRHPIISQWKDSPAPQYGNVSAIIALPENGASFSYSY
jgi:hypothetical protein